jgi:hypothetical protein
MKLEQLNLKIDFYATWAMKKLPSGTYSDTQLWKILRAILLPTSRFDLLLSQMTPSAHDPQSLWDDSHIVHMSKLNIQWISFSTEFVAYICICIKQ